ncbi:MAG: hypothetical protein ACTSRK_18855 [Promethearchaeota archaeon]
MESTTFPESYAESNIYLRWETSFKIKGSFSMIKGIILFSISNPPKAITEEDAAVKARSSNPRPKWKILGEHIPEKSDSPARETNDEIMIRYFSEGSAQQSLNIRLYPYKFHIFPINPEYSLLLVFILDAQEAMEIVQIFPEATIKLILNCSEDSTELAKTLEQLYNNRNRLLSKLEEVKVLREEIGIFANRLIDAGKFDDAQALIKLAKSVPEKMVTIYKRSKQEAKARNYRQARRSLSDCLNLAQKIEDTAIQEYIKLKINIYTQIPQYEKQLKSLIAGFTKELSKSIELPSYQRQIYKLDKTLELLDNLEEDELIEKTLELSNTLILAGKLVFDLKSLDRKIKTIIKEL